GDPARRRGRPAEAVCRESGRPDNATTAELELCPDRVQVAQELVPPHKIEIIPARRTDMPTMQRAKIQTFLWYAHDAEAAAKLYASIFPDSRVDTVWALPVDSPSGPAGSVKVVDFTLLGQPFQAMTAGPHHDFNDAISIVVRCDDQAELDRYWDALIAS